MIPFLASAGVDFIVGLIALSKRDNPSAFALALFTVSLGLWQTELFLLTVIDDAEVLSPWFHLTRIGMFLAPPLLAMMTWRICGGSSKRFRDWIVIPSIGVAVLLSLLNNTLLPSKLVGSESGYLPEPDIIYSAFIYLFLFCIVGSIWLALYSYRKVPQRLRRRIKWLLITLAAIMVFASLSIYLVSQGSFLSKLVGAASNGIFVSVLLYATINHHLTDFGSAMSGLLARVVVIAVLLAFFFSALDVIKGQVGGNAEILFTVLLLIVVLELYSRLLKLAHPSAKRLLLSGGYNMPVVKRQMQYAFKRCIELADLENVLEHLFVKTMHISRYDLAVVEPQQEGATHDQLRFQLDSDEIVLLDSVAKAQLVEGDNDLIMVDEAVASLQLLISERSCIACFPMTYQKQLIGIVFVGPLRSYNNNYFRNDDIRMFEWLADELPGTFQRTLMHDDLLKDLGDAEKTMSLLELMNQYHHDIKAPLSIIDGVVSNDLYDQKRQSEIILEQVARGTQLITMMSSVLHGSRERQTKPVNLQSEIENCLLLFEREIRKREIEFDSMSSVVGDANDLKILFINLIKNSVEAKVEGRPLAIRVFGGETTSYTWIRFMDNGCGMDSLQLDGIWDVRESHKLGGSGVGLRAVKRIADEHGASIVVKSELGVGSSFELRFPMRVKLQGDVYKGVEL